MTELTKHPDFERLDGESNTQEAIRPIAILNVLLRRCWTIVSLTVLAMAITAAWIFTSNEVWTSTAKFLPTRAGGISLRLSATVGNSGPEMEGDQDSASADYYIALVQSPVFLAPLVLQPIAFDDAGNPQNLLDHYRVEGTTEQERLQRGAELLQKSITITAGKATSGVRLVTLTVSANQRNLSADIATALLAAINEHNRTSRGNKATNNRIFVETQLAKASKELDAATNDFAAFSKKNRKIATPDLQAQRDRLERRVRVQEEVFITLTKQLEMSRMEEQETQPVIEVIQPPMPPIVRSAPRRMQMAAVGSTAGFLCACGWVLLSERLRRVDPSNADAQEFRDIVKGIVADVRRMLRFGRRTTA